MSYTLSGSAEKKLLDAAVKGELDIMRTLLNEDPYILDRVSYNNKTTPLHVATMKGHLDFVKHILSCNSQLAKELDAHQSSPLHVASSNGRLEIVRELLQAAPEMCLSLDCHGRNPVHVAAMEGQVEVLKELVEKHTIAAWEKTDRGLTVLHLCVKYQHFGAFKEIVPNLSELLNCKDHDGDNVLHMAARYNQVEIIEILLKMDKKIDVRAINLQGQTAKALFIKQDRTPHDPKSLDIIKMLKPKGDHQEKWLTEQRDAIMVVAILIATMAFQAGVTPPGGVLQAELIKNVTESKENNIGKAVIALLSPKAYKGFMYINTMAFVMSLSAILLLISGLPFKRKFFMWMLMVTMWMTISFISATYAISISVVTPVNSHGHRRSLIKAIVIGIITWGCSLAVLFGGNTVRLLNRWVVKKKGVNIVQLVRQWMHKKCPNLKSSVEQCMAAQQRDGVAASVV